jgi:hypothetical protein
MAQAARQLPGSGVGHSSGAGSPFNNYMVGVAGFMFGIGVLVTVLMGGADLIINIGLLSKRPEDHIGKRTPGDLGILRTNTWPNQPYDQNALPAEEEDFEANYKEEVEYRSPTMEEVRKEEDRPQQPPPQKAA